MSTRQDYLTAIGNMVQGEFPLGEAAKILAISQALKIHNKNRPRTVVEEESGAAVFDYAITLLAEWSEGHSVIKQVEYPADDTEQEASILEDDEWQVYEKPAGKCLRFLEAVPTAAEKFRVTYTALHLCTDDLCTVAVADEDAVQALAAAFFCEMLATYFAQQQDPTIQADVVDHTSKSRDYAARAKAYRKIYYDHLGIEEGKTAPASVTQDQDMTGSWGTDKATHQKRWR